MNNITILRLFCGWYGSTRCCFNNLNNNAIFRIYIVMGDYVHEYNKAVDEFLKNRKINVRLNKIGYVGRIFQKQKL